MSNNPDSGRETAAYSSTPDPDAQRAREHQGLDKQLPARSEAGHKAHISFDLHDPEYLSSRLCVRGLETASSRLPPVDPSSTSTLELRPMLPSASASASTREERVQKAFSVDHHGPGDARLSHSAARPYREYGKATTLA
eukprot:scaffold46019_cov54-Phaeocystis_antarctica.AAC.3